MVRVRVRVGQGCSGSVWLGWPLPRSWSGSQGQGGQGPVVWNSKVTNWLTTGVRIELPGQLKQQSEGCRYPQIWSPLNKFTKMFQFGARCQEEGVWCHEDRDCCGGLSCEVFFLHILSCFFAGRLSLIFICLGREESWWEASLRSRNAFCCLSAKLNWQNKNRYRNLSSTPNLWELITNSPAKAIYLNPIIIHYLNFHKSIG